MSKTSPHVQKKSARGLMNRPPVVLLILDGWGMTEKREHSNAISRAHTPTFDRYWDEMPHALLNASGPAVGLPKGQVGNSEAGHNTIGAGRTVEQEALRILRTIRNKSFFKNPSLLRAMEHVRKQKSRLHFMGLLTDEQSAHAYPSHLHALLKLTEGQKIKECYLHLFTDGRDSGQHAAMKFLKDLEAHLPSNVRIATMMGRYYSMERSKRWKITEKAYNALLLGAPRKAEGPEEAILSAYDRGESDEFIQPTVLGRNDADHDRGRMRDGDAIIFFNLRSDRARQLTKPFVQQAFYKANPHSFQRKKVLRNIAFVALTDFGPDLDHVLTAFPSEPVQHTIPMVLSDLRQCYIAESEKYAHMTYFFNGGHAQPIANEERICIPSPDVQDYATTPLMSAEAITDAVLKRLKTGQFDFYGINFANPDMVGHTGNFHAAVKACEVTDTMVGKIVEETQRRGGTVFLTADHGNAEEIVNPKTGAVDSEHNGNPVPFIVINKKLTDASMETKGSLADVAPTLLSMMGYKPPSEMSKHVLCRAKLPLWS